MGSNGTEQKKEMDVGPWGGVSGVEWDDGRFDGVREITVVHDHHHVNFIQFLYDDNGVSVSTKHGGDGNNDSRKTTMIRLDFPKEFLTSMSGHIDVHEGFGSCVVQSLMFKSNRRTFEKMGVERGYPFDFSIENLGEGVRIVGFMGKSGAALDAIGLHLSHVQPPQAQLFGKEMDVGPWGGGGGVEWDDGRFDGVREITVVHDHHHVNFIQFLYDDNGASVSTKHGGDGNNDSRKTTKIRLDFPKEFLTSMSGHIDVHEGFGSCVIQSLMFKSNRRTFEKMGVERGYPFDFSIENLGEGVRIVGFMGRSGTALDAIGLHLSHVQPPQAQLFGKEMDVGPWGGGGGVEWDDGRFDGVREITVVHDHHHVNFIQFLYDDNGASVSTKHGGDGNNDSRKTTKIRLDFPKEFLTSMSGYIDVHEGFGSCVIQSLMFKSNRRTFEKMGVERGYPFEFSIENLGEGVRIVGFMGKSGAALDAIGLHLSHVQPPQAQLFGKVVNTNDEQKKYMDVGPWGGPGGGKWDDGRYNGVREITIAHGVCIVSIHVVYDDNGIPIHSKHGGCSKHGPWGVSTSTKTKVITLEFPNEFLTSVSGHINKFNGMCVIRSLTLKSNKRTFEKMGVEEGDPFSFSTEEHGDGVHIVGFTGSSGIYMDAIGFHLSRVEQPQAQLFPKVGDEKNEQKETMDVGPWGGEGGISWDDGRYNGVREIVVTYCDRCINFIRVVYDDNGEYVTCQHGRNTNGLTTQIILDFPDEFLTNVSGHIGRANAWLRSLTFTSNRKIFEKIGVEQGEPFSFSTQDPGDGFRIVGFTGRSGEYIDSIGFHLSHVDNLVLGRGGGNTEDDSHIKQKMNIFTGPWGGEGGHKWDDGKYKGVREIIVVYDQFINSIYVVYDDNGRRVSCLHGGNGGKSRTKITLDDYPKEFFTCISGYIGHYNDQLMIRSLAFESNRRTFGAVGIEDGKHFSFSTEKYDNDIRIVGLHGQSDSYLGAIGVHISRARESEGGLYKKVQQKFKKFGCIPP